MGPLMVKTTLDVLGGAPFLESLNKTYIVLIPKKTGSDKMTYFCPISVYNVVYKLILKVLTNRLKQFLREIVRESKRFYPESINNERYSCCLSIISPHEEHKGK
ncbi:hypothetical protein RND81_03G095700 [Saponaria officinalis]|uniref:Reverse transcriptase n=1 Tax=Saponaria officinalis TaxID=3572 RepID=A0AAW1LZB8_SAPOF